MDYPDSSASLEQDNIAFTDYRMLLSLCHSPIEGMTMTFHHLLDHVQIYPFHSTFVAFAQLQTTLPILIIFCYTGPHTL